MHLHLSFTFYMVNYLKRDIYTHCEPVDVAIIVCWYIVFEGISMNGVSIIGLVSHKVVPSITLIMNCNGTLLIAIVSCWLPKSSIWKATA